MYKKKSSQYKSRQDFIDVYVSNANIIGFNVKKTVSGCVYLTHLKPAVYYSARRCYCGRSNCAGWGMFKKK